MPDMQFFLTCPIAQIPLRRAYRQKVGLGTAGQMSTGREHLIVKAFQEMYDCLQGSGMSIYLFENAGIPVPELDEQIQQAIPAFQKVEQLVAEGGFRLAPGQSGQSGQPGQNSESFWLSPERLARIYERQTK